MNSDNYAVFLQSAEYDYCSVHVLICPGQSPALSVSKSEDVTQSILHLNNTLISLANFIWSYMTKCRGRLCKCRPKENQPCEVENGSNWFCRMPSPIKSGQILDSFLCHCLMFKMRGAETRFCLELSASDLDIFVPDSRFMGTRCICSLLSVTRLWKFTVFDVLHTASRSSLSPGVSALSWLQCTSQTFCEYLWS